MGNTQSSTMLFTSEQIKRENNFDGVCNIHYMNYVIKYKNDNIILGAYVDKNDELSFLVTEDDDDMRHYFITIDDLDKDQAVVYKLKDHKILPIVIRKGLSNLTNIEITEGLNAGDEVILQNKGARRRP